ncbi:BtpA/SgcQ family protein [Globicatella sanguinis]
MKKQLIGMIHLKALPTAPDNTLDMEQIFEFAKNDLSALEEGGANAAIVENFFDIPYSTSPNFEIYIAMTNIFTRLKQISKIPLGINIHSCVNDEELVIASLCGAEFIRSESFVESRHSMSGILYPMASKLLRKKKQLDSKTKIYGDVNVKETFPFSPQSLNEAISDAIKGKTDAIIITGFETGNPPNKEQIKAVKEHAGNIPIIIGSGVNRKNIEELIEYADAVIVGSSIKKDNKIENEVCKDRVKELMTIIS